MSVTSNTQIQKVTANNIVGAITDFNTNVLTKVYNYATYHSGNLPKFTGTANYGRGDVGTEGFTNPQAVPSNQLISKSVPTLSLSDTTLTASTLWTAMKNVTVALNKVRYFKANWYHRECLTKADATNTVDSTGGARVLKNSITGRGVFNTSFPAVTTGSDTYNSKTEFWERTGTTSITLAPTSTLTVGAQITAANMNSAITNCYNSWYNSCYTANQLTYNYYTCHLNCHDNCHTSRSRR